MDISRKLLFGSLLSERSAPGVATCGPAGQEPLVYHRRESAVVSPVISSVYSSEGVTAAGEIIGALEMEASLRDPVPWREIWHLINPSQRVLYTPSRAPSSSPSPAQEATPAYTASLETAAKLKRGLWQRLLYRLRHPTERAYGPLAYDGPADEPEMPALKYILYTDVESREPSLLAIPTTASPRRPSLAEYERELTAEGDDRRRPSSSLIRDLQPNEDADEAIHMPRRKPSRSAQLDDEETGLMAQALERAQQEKALFRAPSKLFTKFKFPVARSAHREPSVESLTAPDLAPAAASKKSNKIGTSLKTWTRFPSHSRADRCASAGHVDDVVTRDFATHAPKEQSRKLAKSRSENRLSRYYANLLSAGGRVAQGRRSSVTTGAKLANPDLELL